MINNVVVVSGAEQSGSVIHVYTYMYVYMCLYMCVCVCLCACVHI